MVSIPTTTGESLVEDPLAPANAAECSDPPVPAVVASAGPRAPLPPVAGMRLGTAGAAPPARCAARSLDCGAGASPVDRCAPARSVLPHPAAAATNTAS